MPTSVKTLLITLFISLSATALADQATAETEDQWTPPDPGLLKDPTFDARERGERRVWFESQHAGEKSFEFKAEDGILSITRIGIQPWGIARQTIKIADLAGKTLEFSADVSGEFIESQREKMDGTGLSIKVTQGNSRRIMLMEDAEPALSVGTHDWQRQSVRFKVPEKAGKLQLGIFMGLDGTLRVRGPSLHIVEAAPEDAPAEPEASKSSDSQQTESTFATGAPPKD